MHSVGSNIQLQQNRKLSKRYKNAYRQKLMVLNQSTDGGHSYFTVDQIKKDKSRLKNKIKMQETYKSISLVIVGSLILLYGLAYFLS